MKNLKKAAALLTALCLLLSLCAFAEEDAREAVFEDIELYPGLIVQTAVPAGYTASSLGMGEGVPAGVLVFEPENENDIVMLMSVEYDEECEGLSLNDFTDEQIESYRGSVIEDLDMYDPEVTLTATAYGTKLLVFDENSDTAEQVIISSLYEGKWVSLLLYHNDFTMKISEAEIARGIDLLSETWFRSVSEADVPAEGLAGGWAEAEDGTVTEEMRKLFDLAFEGFAGASYEPFALLGTQVVAGVNYRFLARQTLVTAQPKVAWGYLTLYQDLEGNVTFTDFTPLRADDVN